MSTNLNIETAQQLRELTEDEVSSVAGGQAAIGFYVGPVGFAIDLYDNGKWEVTMVNGDSVTHIRG
jgi:hypothetical protein